MSDGKTAKILALSASLNATNQFCLDEVQGIREELERAKYCNHFELVSEEITSIDDLLHALLKHKPDIIHFSGHGIGEHGIVLEDAGTRQEVSAAALNSLFQWAKKTVKCVLLNGCYSKMQAEVIYQHIDCVIGTNHTISDRAAIKFAAKFYQALIEGESFQSAYDFAHNTLELLNYSDSAAPELLNRIENQDSLAIAKLLPSQHQPELATDSPQPDSQSVSSVNNGEISGTANPFAVTQASDSATISQKNAPQSIDNSGGHISGQVGVAAGDLTQTINNFLGIRTSSQLKPPAVLLISSGVAVLVIVARFLGALQPMELWFYDRLLQSQADLSKVDDRLLVVGITRADYENQKQEEKAGKGKLVGSISNEKLTELFQKLDQLKPVAVGLDLYREEPVDGKRYPALLKRFKTQPNLFTVCKASDASDPNSSEAAPPVGFPLQRVGFSDFASLDREGQVLRRQLLAFQPDEESRCKANISFNLQLANLFLKQHSIEYDAKRLFTADGYCQDLQFTNGVIFPSFLPYTGGYQGYSNSDESTRDSYAGCQVLLKYRNGKINQNAFHSFANRGVAENVSLKDILAKDFPVDRYKNRVILIGVVRSDGGNDYWSTPLANEQIPGVMIQAQMISQIISVASKENSLIWVLPQWQEALCILLASLAGGALGWLTRSNRDLIICMGGMAILGCTGCFLIFSFAGGWLPFIPTVLVLGVSGTIVGLPRLLKLDSSFSQMTT